MVTTLAKGYLSQADYLKWVEKAADGRVSEVSSALRDAFAEHIEQRTTDVILFADIGPKELAEALVTRPLVLKPLLLVCNLAARAVERDLDLRNLNTYKPRLDRDSAIALAGYLKPFLPPFVELPALTVLDRTAFIDKEIRLRKGRWERIVLENLCRGSKREFKKRKFTVEGEEFEIDGACPAEGPISLGIDMKRIEARRDIHKRCDEIVNKAQKFKKAYPEGRFAAVIYYPFIDEHINIQNRLRSDNIDTIVFASASDENIANAARLLLDQLGVSCDE